MNTSLFQVAAVLIFAGVAIAWRAKPSEKIRIGLGTLLMCAGTMLGFVVAVSLLL